MITEPRQTGIDCLGATRWGAHICQFYRSKQDLLEILVPYFKAGLQNREFCMWITSDPLSEEDAHEALRERVVGFEGYLAKGQIEILPHDRWYLKDGRFDSKRVLRGGIKKLDQALENGFDGLRVSGNSSWLGQDDWKEFAAYERELNRGIVRYRVIAICTFCPDLRRPSEIVDMIGAHASALLRNQGEWMLMESYPGDRIKRQRQRFASLLNAHEHERKRIGWEIHDCIGQALSAVKYRVEDVLHQRSKSRMAALIKDVIPMLQQSVEEARRIQADLRPPVLDDLGIRAALSGLLRQFESTYPGVQVEKEMDDEVEHVPESLKTVIFRISQEALNNVAKHSGADLVVFYLTRRGSEVGLSIQDNGDGFAFTAESDASGRTGMGLSSMRERAELSGGTFTIHSAKGSGTTIKASWRMPS
ncbi:MAG: MEDS domain-containing protein [bacterium]